MHKPQVNAEPRRAENRRETRQTMKKLKALISSLLVAAVIVGSGAVVGCKKSQPKPADSHTHTFSEKWLWDNEKHWRNSTCNDNEIADEGAHVLDSEGRCKCGYPTFNYTVNWNWDSDQHWRPAGYGGSTSAGEKANHTLDGDKKCTVCDYRQFVGVKVTKTTTHYEMGKNATISVPLDDIKVELVLDGAKFRDVSADEYTLSVYRGSEKLENLNAVTAGAYNIVVETEVAGATRSAFVVVYVTDTIRFIRLASGSVTEQIIGGDKISSTWKFEAVYTSGAIKTLGLSDVSVRNFTTTAETDNGEAIIGYNDVQCDGTVTPKETQVSYKITVPTDGTATVKRNTYDYNVLKATVSDPAAGTIKGLKQSNFTGANAFLTVVGDDLQYRGPSNNVLEVKGEALSVTFDGTGALEIEANSTSSSNTSIIYIVDEEGNYIEASYSGNAVSKDNDRNIYGILGNSPVKLSFGIVKSGTYRICTARDIEVGDEIVESSSYLRLQAIKMIGVVLSA